ncbi:MAG: hypothetical protein Q9163_000149 [Psora crenata]
MADLSKGARFGPRAIRAASARQLPFQAFNPRRGLNPYGSAYTILDCGDIPVSPFDNALALMQMTSAFLELGSRSPALSHPTNPTPKLLTLGGDHSVALPALRALNKIYGGPVAVVHFDAHLDTWHPAKYPSAWSSVQSDYTHGSMFWMASNEGLIINGSSVHGGLRSRLLGWEDYDDDTRQGFLQINADDIDDLGTRGIIDLILERVGTELPVYLSVDIDVIDPGLCPGTGTPEPGGWTSREMIRILRGLERLNIVGADIVEVAPAYDGRGEQTALVASQIGFHMSEPVAPPAVQHDKQRVVSTEDEHDQSSLSSSDVQTGVKGIEAISETWTTWSLIAAYLGIFLLAFCTSLEGQTTSNLTVYATSAFVQHSLVSTVFVVQGVVNAVIKPPMAKIANVFGRLEAFTFSVFLYVVGYIQMAASNNVETFASAQIFYSAGATGLQILQQIFIADTSDLLNRALFSSLPDIPFLITIWVGPPIADSLLDHTTWRWGYGIWTIVLPAAFLPLALSLYLNMRKAARLHLLPPSPWHGRSFAGGFKSLCYDLDVMGLLLLSTAVSLILIPLTLAATAKSGWRNASIIAMLVVGCVCLVVFPAWESIPKLAPYPFLSLRLLKDRTVLTGCAIGFFYFAVFYTSVQPYFSSYLQVVQSNSVTAAGHIVNVFSFSSTVASIVISLIIKYTGHYKYYITAGACIYILGVGLMIRYRVQESTTAQIVGTQIALGIGGGLINVPAQLGVQASVAHTDVAAATAIFLTILEIGGAVGNAISGAVWTGNLLPKLQRYLPPVAQEDAVTIYGNLTAAKSYERNSLEGMAIDRSYQETMNILLIIATCLAVPLLPLSLLMRNYKLDAIEQKVRGKVIGSDRARTVSGGGANGSRDHAADDQHEGRGKGWLAKLRR